MIASLNVCDSRIYGIHCRRGGSDARARELLKCRIHWTKQGEVMLKSKLLAAPAQRSLHVRVRPRRWPTSPSSPGRADRPRRRCARSSTSTTKPRDSKATLLYFSRDNFFDKMLAELRRRLEGIRRHADGDLQRRQIRAVHGADRRPDHRRRLKVFPQSAIDSQSYDGHVYGIPTDLSLHFLYYRTDLIDQLLSDDAWKAKYEEISREVHGPEDGAQAARPTGPGTTSSPPPCSSPSRSIPTARSATAPCCR